MSKEPVREKTKQEPDEEYLRARRVRSQHAWFMREVVMPCRRGKE